MQIDFTEKIEFKGKQILGQPPKEILFNVLSQYGGLAGEQKAAVSHILGELASSDGEIEIEKTGLEHLIEAWNGACNSDQLQVPLMHDEAISNWLEDKLEDMED